MIGRLTINTIQSCNLNCIYCYANGGEYNGAPVKLNTQAAIKSLKELSTIHKNIKIVQFIGGEPLLNLSAMNTICHEIDILVKEKVLNQMPKIAAITNLTVLTKKHLELFKRYKFNLTVSLDGPKYIHDQLRLTKQNKGTYDRIVTNIGRIEKENIPYSFEATYTKIHYKMKINFIDLLDYFSRFNPLSIDIVTSALSDTACNDLSLHDNEIKDIITWQIDAINYCIQKLYSKTIIPYGLLRDAVSIIASNKKYMESFCPAEKTNFSISSDGEVYGCHMFTNKKHHVLYNNQCQLNVSYKKLPSKSDFSKCVDCWARQWCRVCVGNMEIRSLENPRPEWFNCELNKKTLQTTLQLLPAALESLYI